MQAIWDNRHRVAGKLGLVAAVACAAYVGVASWWVNVEYNADPREFLVTTQSSPEVKRVSKEVLAAPPPPAARAATCAWWSTPRTARRSRTPGTSATSTTRPTSTSPAPRCPTPTWRSSPRAAAPARPRRCAATRGGEFPFRVWWVRDYGAMSPANWARWFTERKPWNPPGGMPEWLYVRRGA